MIQKWTARLLAVLLLALSGTALAQAEPHELVIANPTRLGGRFFTSLWGNNSADVDLRFFVHGQGTIAYLRENVQAVNRTVVKAHRRTADALGNITHTFTLWDDLHFSDGSPATARDFAGSVLLQAGPQLLSLSGAEQPAYADLLGQEAYFRGGAGTLSGLRLLDEYTFSLTIRADALPNYNELSLVDVIPYPMALLLPGTDIQDAGQGAGFSPAIDAAALSETILGENGYLSHPAVGFGPYRLLSYDAALGVARLARSPWYKGDDSGRKPSIELIRLEGADNETMVGLLKSGQIDLINKITWQGAVQEAQAAQRQGELQTLSYSRRGLAYLAVSGDGPLASLPLRRAFASLIDREGIIKSALSSNGVPVYGYYGLGQEMASGREAELKKMLDRYPFSASAAEKLLSEDGWVYASDGSLLASGRAGQRYRRVENTLEPLALRLAVSRGNPIALAVADNLRERFSRVGGTLSTVEIDTKDLFDAAYGRGQESYDLVFMGSNFDPVFNPKSGPFFLPGGTDEAFLSHCDNLDSVYTRIVI